VLGTGSIDQAHTAVEWVDLREVVAAVDVYEAIARSLAVVGAPAPVTRP
jgi:acetylornithine deacetylase/succinyl-diaminopimelate desuccinylase-like protein